MAPVARPGSDDTTRKSRHKKTDFSKPARKDHGDAVVAKGGKPARHVETLHPTGWQTQWP